MNDRSQLTEVAAPGVLARVGQFARLLRDNGFTAAQAETADAIRFLAESAEQTPPSERTLREALRALYCSRRSELDRFDELFDAYWNRRVGRRRSRVSPGASAQQRSFGEHGAAASGGQGLAQYFDWANSSGGEGEQDGGDSEGDPDRLGGGRAAANSAKQDFGKITDPDEAERLLALAERLGARMRHRLSRRRREARRGRRINIRQTLRRSLPTGGVPLRLNRTTRREPPVNLVAFVDVSGSMDAYSMFFMRFVHALTGGTTRTEAFLFHTKLVHITGTLREADPVKMVEKMTLISQGWSGGTRIGAAIDSFNRLYANEFANSRTVVLILSDGYDTGAPDDLAASLGQLRRNCSKIIWLNPLLGRESYAPVAQGMAAATPYLDLFAPAHNLDSLMALEDALVRA